MNHLTHPLVKALGAASSVAVLAAAASIGPVHAADVAGQDWKGYAGTNCQPHLPSDPIRRSAVNQIALANTGTSTVTVYCPIVRDDPDGAGGVAAVAVRFRNRNPTVAGSCEFASYDQTGTKIATKSAAAPLGETTLQLGPLNAHNWGAFVLICQIPGRDPATGLQSYIVNYRVDETL